MGKKILISWMSERIILSIVSPVWATQAAVLVLCLRDKELDSSSASCKNYKVWLGDGLGAILRNNYEHVLKWEHIFK